jgi:hypothetical protein
MYSPNFSELAAVSVRRLAWAMGASMGQAVDVLVKALPAFINSKSVRSLQGQNKVFRVRLQVRRRNARKSPCPALFRGVAMSISTIHGLQRYVKRHSGFTGKTINSVIIALGYHPLHGTAKDFKELSGIFVDCSKKGADTGFTGFTYYNDTVPFFTKHRLDIINHLEHTAEQMETDVISMVLNFKEFRNNDDAPNPSEVGKALWDRSINYSDYTELYNLFAWYTLEEVSRTWHKYLIDNPAVQEALAA